MAAVYYQYQNNKDIFLKNVSMSTPVSVSGFPDPGPGMLILTTGVGIETSETIQYFLTFDDVIDFMWFGKGVGSLVVSGMAFLDCSGSFNSLAAFYGWVASNRGKVVNVSLAGNTWFSGPVAGTSVNIMSEPDTYAEFTVHIAMTNHSLGATGANGGSC